jgi:predicted hotdog family 3-hydroxylacyl-ACP dehydratase
MMQLDHDAIEQLVPHRGPMCLLDRLEQWSEASIVCTASNFRNPRHPLRSRSGLLASAAIEYAAQAMALHGALLGRASGKPPSAGYLASARSVRLSRWRLDDLPFSDVNRNASVDETTRDALRIEATRQAGDARQILYAFTVDHRSIRIAEGRAAVVLDTPLAMP